MNALDLLQAVVMLGMPLVLTSWVLFSWLFNTGLIDRSHDNKTISAQVKKLKEKAGKKAGKRRNYLYEKWLWFGSGFYGLAGLWTFIVIVTGQFFGFISNISAAASVFENGLLAGVMAILIAQLGNLLEALLWFTWWPADSILLWVLVAYLGYWCGIAMAKRDMGVPASLRLWLAKLPIDKFKSG
jgi:hypothetical protein